MSAETETDKLVVPIHQGPEHGYWGYVPDETPNEAYTVAGQTDTGATAKATDTPKTAKGATK